MTRLPEVNSSGSSNRTVVWVRTQFEGIHRWKEAPNDVGFLRDWHRHIFYVQLGVEVGGLNREVEFFQLQRKLIAYLPKYAGQLFESSCEMIATDLLERFGAAVVSVSEDGENGATVYCNDVQVEGVVNGPLQGLNTVHGAKTPGNPIKRRTNGTRPLTTEVKTRCFVGVEAEGPNRGATVLFVPGRTDPHGFEMTYLKTEVDRIYYGAGNDRSIRQDTLIAIMGKGLPVDVEVESIPGCEFLDYLNHETTVISLDPADVHDVDYIKVVTPDAVVWLPTKDGYFTSLDDPLFAQDRIVD